MAKKDSITADLFEIPQPVQGAGSLECRKQIASLMSEALKGLDRYIVAAEMSKLLGEGREVTKSMLDAYTSEARETQIPPFDKAIAFDMATGSYSLISFYSQKIGGKTLLGKEALDAEIGKFERIKTEANERIKELKNQQRGNS